MESMLTIAIFIGSPDEAKAHYVSDYIKNLKLQLAYAGREKDTMKGYSISISF